MKRKRQTMQMVSRKLYAAQEQCELDELLKALRKKKHWTVEDMEE
jgi:hypothetical protein